jgi:hypothetical protein
MFFIIGINIFAAREGSRTLFCFSALIHQSIIL